MNPTATQRAAAGAEKLCPQCGEWWPADSEFFAATEGGLASCCIACRREMNKRSARREEARTRPAISPELQLLAAWPFGRRAALSQSNQGAGNG